MACSHPPRANLNLRDRWHDLCAHRQDDDHCLATASEVTKMRLARWFVALICIAFSACQSTPADVARTWSLPPGVKFLRVNGYDMAYVERGAGVPVVLVHGSLSDYRYFAAQMEPFSARHRVISVSLRHYYPEHWDGNGSDFSYQQHAADVAAFIQALNAGPVHLIGHSRGGTVAMFVANAHPELVRSLVIAEGGRNVRAFMPTDPKYAEEAKAAAALSRQVLERLNQGDIEGWAFDVCRLSERAPRVGGKVSGDGQAGLPRQRLDDQGRRQ
jgi:pimeloyl-ACP methyl ester carboxylesterase